MAVTLVQLKTDIKAITDANLVATQTQWDIYKAATDFILNFEVRACNYGVYEELIALSDMEDHRTEYKLP